MIPNGHKIFLLLITAYLAVITLKLALQQLAMFEK